MQGTITQLLSLTCYGNYFLESKPIKNYYPNHVEFKFCKFIKFVDLAGKGKKFTIIPHSENPTEWFENLKVEGVLQFRARYFPGGCKDISDRVSVAFAGGGCRWIIETIKPNGSDYWEARWNAGDDVDPDEDFWQVTYGRVAKNVINESRQMPSIESIKSELTVTLQDISKFAHSNDYPNFGKCFDRGLKALNVHNNKNSKYQIYPPSYLPQQSEAILNACEKAWVFGGMGSWNDIGFCDSKVQKKYEALSEQLFRQIHIALEVAVNPWPRPAITIIPERKKWWQIWK
jgi:hypothetical protein